ncbi:MAG: YncE family protein [Candidatus Saccharibacteria bacterium]
MIRKKLVAIVSVLAILSSVLLPAQTVFAGFLIVNIITHPTPVSTQAIGNFTFGNTGPAECKIDDGAFAPCDTPYSTPPLANGEHTLTLHGIDATNPQGTATYTWTVDLPSIKITSPTASTTIFDGPLTVTGTSASDVLVDVTVDGVLAGTADPGAGTTWSLKIPHVTAGNHTISAQMRQKRQYAYMANRGTGAIDVVDVVSKAYVHEILGPDVYYAAIFNARDNRMYAASQWNGTCAIKIFNATTFAVEDSISMSGDGSYPISLALDPASNKLYEVCNDGNGGYNVIVYDTNTYAPTGSFDLNLDPGDYPSGITINPSNTEVWVRYNKGIKEYDLTSPTFDLLNTDELDPSGNAVNNIVFNQAGTRAYTADSNTDQVYTINIFNATMEAHTVSSNLSNLAFTPDFTKLYGISSGTSSIYVLNPSDLSVLDVQGTNQPPESLAITGDGLDFVVGDDHGSGEIYFGSTSGNATVTNTITAPNGGSYLTTTGNFIAPPHYGVLGEATSVAVSVKAAASVPNTGFAR